ncbi:hypothetical protein WMF28_14735 [Sorangium sp. So ce590]|uniref:hypothetical protein n=1 Tax=Sorangium sp. So ce590 TaxID=3133317 RepID=UPI003F61A8B0
MKCQGAAREHGGVLGLQGDVPCGGDGVFSKYSPDPEAQDRRIRSALAACGGEAEDLVVIGYFGRCPERATERCGRRAGHG